MGIDSINEPGQRTVMMTPVSINEPPQIPEDAAEPVISELTPSSCVIGEADFTLLVAGTGFYPGSIIHFAGYDEPTTYADGTLSTGVKPSLWQNPDVVQVQVKNGPVLSNAVDFAFNAPASRGVEETDPDELEDEIEQAEEEGDFKSMHPRRKRR
jgi:hypothetical protein